MLLTPSAVWVRHGVPMDRETAVSCWRECGFTEAYTAAGGSSTVVHLPEEGITGNSYFMFQELNNDVIANHVEAWIQEDVN